MEDQPVRIFNTYRYQKVFAEKFPFFYSMGSSAGNTLPLRWHRYKRTLTHISPFFIHLYLTDYVDTKNYSSDYGVFTGGHSCNNGLVIISMINVTKDYQHPQVMWLPVLEPAHYAGNGLVLAEGSHK